MPAAHTPRRIIARAALLAAVALAGCALPGCGTAQPGGPGHSTLVIKRDASSGTKVHVSVGDRIEVILSSTYWTVRGSSAPAVVHQDGATAYLPGRAQCVPGAGCGLVRTYFTARSAGTAVITAHRLSCGEALLCRPSQRHFVLTVEVR